MKVWVLVLGTGGLYGIGYRGGTACYTDRGKAEEMVSVITDWDPKYVESRSGLSLKSIEADEGVLNALKLYVWKEGWG